MTEENENLPEPEDAEAPEVVAHSEDDEGEETPWCGVHQEKSLS
ncbi:hypothetical protein AB0O28_03410 [Microbispora sp. NPDC088329]